MFSTIIFQLFAQVKNCPSGAIDDPNCASAFPEVAADSSTVVMAIQLALGIIAGVALLIIVLQGFRFVMSKGEPDRATEARKGVIYAAVGLGVTLVAEVVVTFFLGRILK